MDLLCMVQPTMDLLWTHAQPMLNSFCLSQHRDTILWTLLDFEKCFRITFVCLFV